MSDPLEFEPDSEPIEEPVVLDDNDEIEYDDNGEEEFDFDDTIS